MKKNHCCPQSIIYLPPPTEKIQKELNETKQKINIFINQLIFLIEEKKSAENYLAGLKFLKNNQ